MASPKLELPPWWAWPLIVLMFPVAVVVMMALLIAIMVVGPIIMFYSLLNFPAHRRARQRLREEDESLRLSLTAQGRYISPGKLPELQQVSRGTFLVESRSPKEWGRIWWTADDLSQQPPLDSMREVPVNSSAWNSSELEQFARQCQETQLDPAEGKGYLVEGKPQEVLRQFPETPAYLLAKWFPEEYQIYPMVD
ncbi:hypothetical protein AB1L30_04565 [Bremerella sp. JC817]|uniref:hypothetical protein n=1 Tax=Bremerella sp. JC817 TaxID=3231756 RepID=UPI00345905FA